MYPRNKSISITLKKEIGVNATMRPENIRWKQDLNCDRENQAILDAKGPVRPSYTQVIPCNGWEFDTQVSIVLTLLPLGFAMMCLGRPYAKDLDIALKSEKEFEEE